MNLTVKEIPKDWEDEECLSFLFAPFRKRELNPTGYDCKMTSWKNLIDRTLIEHNCCSFTLDQLQSAFSYQEREPVCLEEVIDDMLSNGEIKDQSSFEALTLSVDSWSNWAVNAFISTPMKWSFNKLKESIFDPAPVCYESRFVSLSLTKKIASNLLAKINNHRDQIWPIEEVIAISKDVVVENDLDFVIHSLELEGVAAVAYVGNRKLIKFAKSGKKVEPITDADTAIFSLEQSKHHLVSSIENLETKKQAIVQEAKIYLKKGMRPMAKSCLKQKKELEKQIDKQVTALDNIHVLLARVHDTDSNAKVFETYKVSISALKNQLTEAGLSEDGVFNTMAEVQEVLDVHEDIQSALGEIASPAVGDEEYEAELEDLLRNKETQRQPELLDMNVLDLPEPPTESPTSVKVPTKQVRNLQKALK